jgi:hypothetical protein
MMGGEQGGPGGPDIDFATAFTEGPMMGGEQGNPMMGGEQGDPMMGDGEGEQFTLADEALGGTLDGMTEQGGNPQDAPTQNDGPEQDPMGAGIEDPEPSDEADQAPIDIA